MFPPQNMGRFCPKKTYNGGQTFLGKIFLGRVNERSNDQNMSR